MNVNVVVNVTANNPYDFDVKYDESLDAVVFVDSYGHIYNCSDLADMQILRNILCGRIKDYKRYNGILKDKLGRIEDIIYERTGEGL